MYNFRRKVNILLQLIYSIVSILSTFSLSCYVCKGISVSQIIFPTLYASFTFLIDLLNQYIGSVYQKMTEILKKGLHERSEEDHKLLKKYKQVMQNKSG